MDIKREIDIKDDVLENIDSQHFGQDSELEETQKEKFCPNRDFEEEIEIKNEPLDINEEYTENGQNENQVLN
ncbi:hypothetical protein Avbf_06324 [Armadillidium vulgare]|nr:hypothetical protein Avbf_06324 [Armadillidium vulgare]